MSVQRCCLIALVGLFFIHSARAGEVHVAVAANFTRAAKALSLRFEAETGHSALFSFGATGQLYTQIVQGAPFDVFLAADQERPALAAKTGLGLAPSRFTYALGQLALYSRDPGRVRGPETLKDNQITRIAIANPALAPYGKAALATLDALGMKTVSAGRIIRGNSITQTYQFIATGNAEIGFVALSQIVGHSDGSRWLVPADLYPALAQDAILLAQGADNPAATAFMTFLQGPVARDLIETYGYRTEN